MKKVHIQCLLTLLTAMLFSASFFGQSDSTLFGISRNSATQEIFLSKLEPSSGQLAVLSASSVTSTYVWNSLATIDPFQQIYYFNSMDSLYGIDVATGTVASTAKIGPPGSGYFDFMQFNTSDSSIYGLRRTGGFPTSFTLVTIDPLTGTMTDVGTTSFQALLSVTAMGVIDPMNNLFYVQSLTALMGIDMLTGEVMVNIPLNLPDNSYLDFMRVNYADSLLYGIRRHSQTTGSYLCQIDPTSGDVTPLSAEPFFQGLTVGNALGTIDPNNGIFYVTGRPTVPGIETHLYGVALESGEIVVDNVMNIPVNGYFDLMCYFPDRGPTPAFILNSGTSPDKNQFSMYPNPVRSELTISLRSGMGTGSFEIINLQGLKIRSGLLQDSKTKIDVSDLDAGMYLVVGRSESGIRSEKIMVY